MGAFITKDSRYSKTINKYKKAFEKSKISMPYEHNGVLYRQILFNKPIGKSICGFVIITEDGMPVYDNKLIAELTKPFFYMETLMNDEYINNLKRTILSDDQKQKEIENNKKVIFALNALKRDNVKGTDVVIEILNQLPENKVENNKFVLEFIDKVEEYNKKDIIFNEQIIQDVFLYHKKTLMKNLERVKLINSGRDYYDDIKNSISGRNKIKRRSKGRDFTLCAYNLDYTIDYFRNMLILYDKVIDMSENQYNEYLQNMENKRIEERLTLSRC